MIIKSAQIETSIKYKDISIRIDMIEISKNYVDVIEIKSCKEYAINKAFDYQEKQAALAAGIIGEIGLDGVNITEDMLIRTWVWKLDRFTELDDWQENIRKFSVNLNIYDVLDEMTIRASELKQDIINGVLPECDKKHCRKCGAKEICRRAK